MFFRNLTMFRIPKPLADLLRDIPALAHSLGEAPLKPVGPLEMFSRGFVSPYGRHYEQLVHSGPESCWVTLGGEDKILPAAVVNDLVAKRANEIEQREGRRLGGRARKRLKEDVLHELLPNALVRSGRAGIHIDYAHCIVAVDTSSRKVAEGAISELRAALGSFPAVPVNAEVAPRSVLTGWLTGDALPPGFSLGDECELKDPIDQGAVVKAQRQELAAEEISNHIEAGKQCSRLAMCVDDSISFVLGDDLVVRKLKFLDGALDRLDEGSWESIQMEAEARHTLMALELGRLFGVLGRVFKISST